MKNKSVLPLVLVLAGCSALSRGYIHTTGEDSIVESTYAYGYAIIGEQSELYLSFRNVTTKERKTYTKLWADNQMYKEHIFVFSLPEGTWEFEQVATGGGRHGGFQHEVKRSFEIRQGFGSFLGKFGTHEDPRKDLLVDSVTRIIIKREIDSFMETRYGQFDASKTIFAEYKRFPH